jgi:anthranilate/para-aminobenzoate synthase component I
MEIVAELERGPRGFYTGALGLFDPRGTASSACRSGPGIVATACSAGTPGGGIVVDSDADRELDECWLKTAAVRAALADDATALDRCSSG